MNKLKKTHKYLIKCKKLNQINQKLIKQKLFSKITKKGSFYKLKKKSYKFKI